MTHVMAEKHMYRLSIYCVTCRPLPPEGFAATRNPENLSTEVSRLELDIEGGGLHEGHDDECQ